MTKKDQENKKPSRRPSLLKTGPKIGLKADKNQNQFKGVLSPSRPQFIDPEVDEQPSYADKHPNRSHAV